MRPIAFGRPPWGRREWIGRAVVPVMLAAAVLWQTSLFRVACSAVFDEWAYLQLALEIFRHGRLTSPANLGVAPLPILISYWLPVLALPGDLRTIPLYAGAIDLARLAHAVLVGVPLVLFPYAWMARRRGYAAAAAVGMLLAFSPVMLGASSVAVTDACLALFALLAIGTLDSYIRRPTRRRLLLLGAAIGVALAAKYSAAFLIPLSLAALVGSALSKRPERRSLGIVFHEVADAACKTIALSLVALLISSALHAFAWLPLLSRGWPGPVSDWPQLVHLGHTVPLPALFHGVFVQWLHMQQGQMAFLMGQLSQHGWWYYFPCVFLFKSTPAELLLAALLPFLLWRVRRRADATPRLWILAILLLGAATARSTLDLGIRYVLLVYPLLVLSAVDLLASARRPARARLAMIVAVFLVALQIASGILAAPRYLGYMNRLFTRPGEGYRYVADSNIDWGQDLPALRDAMSRRGGARVLFAYFGSSAPIEAYRIDAVLWESSDRAAAEQCRWFALSSSYRSGLHPAFAAFRGLRPDERAGDSIFIYNVGRADVRRALGEARSVPGGGDRPMDQDSVPVPLRPPAARRAFEVLGGWFLFAALAFVLTAGRGMSPIFSEGTTEA
jgi:4-amino-4-deoxy-L-arabinose transferase-like glycosyltransferase